MRLLEIQIQRYGNKVDILTGFHQIVNIFCETFIYRGIYIMTILTKTILAGVLGSDVVVSSIAWSGTDNVSNIKGNISSMKQNALEAIADNGFLKDELIRLKGYYSHATTEANSKIVALNQAKYELEQKVADLQAQLDAKADTTAEQAEMQAEIDRLEGELEKANAQIAELETYAQKADADVSYDPMTEAEKCELTTEPVNIETANVGETTPMVNTYPNLPYGVTEEAIALDKQRVDMMANESTIQSIEADFNGGENAYLDIIGIKVLNGQLAYVISNDINPNNLPVVSGMAHNLVVNELGYDEMHFMLPQEDETSSIFYVKGANVYLTK